MVNVKTDVTPLGEEFRKREILIGRRFPPMNEWLRVSVGTEDEMNRFMKAFKEILSSKKTETKSGA
jgi:histidinol-phosphate aminotransferase